MSEVHSIIPGLMTLASGGSLLTYRKDDRVPAMSVEESRTLSQFVKWGGNNRLPHEMADIVRKSTVLSPALRKMARLRFGDGPEYLVRDTNNKTGEVSWIAHYDKDIETWMEDTDALGVFMNMQHNFSYYENVFAGLQTSLNKKFINRIWCEKTEQARYTWQDSNGYIPQVLVSANWKRSSDLSEVLRVPALDPGFKVAEQIRQRAGSRFILPITLGQTSPDENFYSSPSWYSAVKAIGLTLHFPSRHLKRP